MTTQDNNEAASALPRKRYTHINGFSDGCEYVEFAEGSEVGMAFKKRIVACNITTTRARAKEFVRDGDWRELDIAAASASQSSTPVPRVGGDTSFDTPELREILNVIAAHGDITHHDITRLSDYFLAHVARQRQESCAYPRCACDSRAQCKSTPSAAVAEGVDTPEFRKLRDACFTVPREATPEQNAAYLAFLAHIETVYGAQQREAGRREGIAQAAAEADHWQKIGTPGHKCGDYIAGAIRSLAAVPPAKAEGMSDTERMDWLEVAAENGCVTTCFEIDGGVHLTLEGVSEAPETYRNADNVRSAIDRAILAQQAKKEGAA